MKTINDMNENELRSLLHEIATTFQIGSAVRDAMTIMTNVCNSAKHEFCIKKPSARVVELVDRLVAPGEKCCAVSASECQEIRDYIIDAAGWDYEKVGEDDEE